MKQAIINFILITCISFNLFSQDKPEKENGLFYKVSVGLTFMSNPEFNQYEDESRIVPNGTFLNNTVGYVLDKRSTIGLNLEYDWYFKQRLKFLPTYLTYRYNIIADDDNFFARVGYGNLWKVSKSYKKGTMYKIGLGYQTFDDNFRNSWLVGIDFSRKHFGLDRLEKISSVSLFIEFQVF